MSSKYRMIWRLMEGQRLRYGAAIGAMVVGSCFMYLVPLVPQVVIDGVLSNDPEQKGEQQPRCDETPHSPRSY